MSEHIADFSLATAEESLSERVRVSIELLEAIVEDLNAKVKLLKQLQQINASGALYATNTSSLSVSAIAGELPYPERIAGLHFFNPAHLMKLVEVVRAEQSGEEVINALSWVAKKLGKAAVICSDSPGFIVNHVARPYYLEALKLVEDFRTEPSCVDNLLEASGFRMGPFKLMDLIGNDINYAVTTSVYEALGKPERLKPSAKQKEMVDEGKLGKKTGEGFYKYDVRK